MKSRKTGKVAVSFESFHLGVLYQDCKNCDFGVDSEVYSVSFVA